MINFWAVKWRVNVPFSEHGLKETVCLFCHSLHPAAWNLELALGPREDKGHILGMVEQKDDNEATETRAKLTIFCASHCYLGSILCFCSLILVSMMNS